MKDHKPLTELELEIVKLRYFKKLHCQQIADTTGLTLHQVKYRLRKANVKNYVKRVIMTSFKLLRIAELEAKLRNPCVAYLSYIIKELSCQTHQWLSKGQKLIYSDSVRCNRRRMRALRMLGKIYNLTGRRLRNEQQIRNAINNYVFSMKAELEQLRKDLFGNR